MASRTRVHLLVLFLLVVAITTATRPARAYTIASAVSEGCHEAVTSDALRAVRQARAQAAPIAPISGDDEALVEDLPFDADRDMRDLAAVALLVGVRDNDLKGRSPKDLSRLAGVHGDPELQPEHCLRGPDRLEPDGTPRAIQDCRAFILRRVGEALDGLDAQGNPDPARRVDLRVHLSVRGRIDVSLPVYWTRMGQAMHAIQDSFTHAYRTPGGERITVTLDWFNTVRGKNDEAVTGPSHVDLLDECNGGDELRRRRRELAVEASRELLDVTLDPALGREAKLGAVNALLDRHLGYEAGCTFENGWCDAPERAFAQASACGCRLVDGRSGPGLGIALGGLAVMLLATWRRCARRGAKGKAGALAATAVLLLAGPARAEGTAEPAPEATTTTTTPAPPPEPPPHAPVPEPGPPDPKKRAFGVAAGGAGSFDRTAAAVNAGARLRIDDRWAVGLDAEWNPFLNFTGKEVRSGTVNVYGSLMVRFRLARENFNLRTTLSAGVSRLIIDLYGAPAGSTGIFAGIYPLGLEWKASRWFVVVVNPLGAAVPIPQLSGVPFLYPQYRTNVGVEAYF